MAPQGSGHVVLDEAVDESYEPTDKEIAEYATWLGMDAESDRELFWIAREGLKAPLPKSWKPCQTEDDEIFYFNFETGESVWDHPCDEHYRKLFKEEKARREREGKDVVPCKKPKKKGAVKSSKPDGSRPARHVSFDLGGVAMELPGPGESLFGKQSQRNVVFGPRARRTCPREEGAQQDEASSSSASSSGSGAVVPALTRKPSLGPLAPLLQPVAPEGSGEAAEQSVDAGEAASKGSDATEDEPEVLDCCCVEWSELRQDFERRWSKGVQEFQSSLASELESRKAEFLSQLSADLEAQLRFRRQEEREVEARIRAWADKLERNRREELEREVEERVGAWAVELEQRRRGELELEVEERLRNERTASEVLARVEASLQREAEEGLRPCMEELVRRTQARLERAAEEEACVRAEKETDERLGSRLAELELRVRDSLEQRVEERLQTMFAGLEQEARAKFQCAVTVEEDEMPPLLSFTRAVRCTLVATEPEAQEAQDPREVPEATEAGEEGAEDEVCHPCNKSEVDDLLERLGEDLDGADAPELIDQLLERLDARPAAAQGMGTAALAGDDERPSSSHPAETFEASTPPTSGLAAPAAARAQVDTAPRPDEAPQAEHEAELAATEEDSDSLSEEIPEEILEEEDGSEEEGESHCCETTSLGHRRVAAPLAGPQCSAAAAGAGSKEDNWEEDTRSDASGYTLVFEPLSPSSAASHTGSEIPEDLPSPSNCSEAGSEVAPAGGSPSAAASKALVRAPAAATVLAAAPIGGSPSATASKVFGRAPAVASVLAATWAVALALHSLGWVPLAGVGGW